MKKIFLVLILLFTLNVKGETITITSNTKLSDKEFSDNREQSNVLVINNSELKINVCKINKEGNGTDSLSDTPNNAAVFIKEKGSIKGEKIEVNTNGIFSHGLYFSNSDGEINDSTIKTNDKYSTGIIVDGGKVVVSKTNIETMEHDSSDIYVISGEIEINDSNLITNSVDSPLFKTASKISINNSKLISNKAEGIVAIAGSDINLSNTILETNNISAEEANFTSIYLYNPIKVDDNIVFKAINSKFDTKIGNTFIVDNTNVDINLENNEIINTNGIFLKATNLSEDNNKINIKLNKQEVKGDIALDNNVSLDMYLDNSVYIGSINTNSLSKDVNITITKNSKLTLTGNVNVNSLTNGDYDNNNIDLNGYKLYINGEELSKDNIKHLNEKNDTMFIVLGFIIGVLLGYSVIYLYIKSKRIK